MPNRSRETAQELIKDWHALFMLPRSIWLPILAMSLIAVAAFLFNEWSVGRIRTGSDELTKLMVMQNDLIDLRAQLTDAETGQRGFLLSRDPQYLQPYEISLARLAVLSSQLTVQAAGDPLLLERVQRLDALRSQKMAELRATILLAQQGQRDDALVILRTGEGRKVMDAFRQEAEGLLSDLKRRVANVRAGADYNVQLSRIAFAALGMLTLGLLVVAVRLLITDFWRQEEARAEQTQERLRLEQIVGERTAELSELTTHLQTITEQEKAELARDLHDEMGGLLTAAKMDLAWLQGRASANQPEVLAKLDALAGGIDEAMDVKRRVVENLRPALLDHFGLPTALQAYFEETCKKAGLGCTIHIPTGFEHLPRELSIALFRVSQESLTNIIRHAHASNVEIRLEADDEQYRMRITDDGVGIHPDELSGAMSHGLVGMRHRIDTLKGQFRIGVNVPRGTRIDVAVPRRSA